MLDDFPPPPPSKTSWPWTEETPQSPGTLPDGCPWPRISIVTPNYNYGQYLEETIRSVLLQGYPNLEYIIIDGGSTDNSVEIIKKYEPWLTYWVSEPDRGQSHAINKGWEKATGEILAWLNSDDYLMPGVLHEVARLYISNPRIGFIHGQAEMRDQQGMLLRIRGREFDLIDSLKRAHNPVAQPSTFITRTAIEEVGRLDESLHMSMDWDLWVRIGLSLDTLFVPQVWSVYRRIRGTKTSCYPMGYGPDMLRVICKVFSENRWDRRFSKIKRAAFASAYTLCSMVYLKDGNWVEARRTFWKALLLDPFAARKKAGSLFFHLLLAGKFLRTLIQIKRIIASR